MNQNYYNNEYMPKMHKIGKITGILAVIASFLPALVLGLVYGMWPDMAALGTAFVTATASFGFLWVIEPISYYPVVGPVGTYMAFVSGNISNMRVPCAAVAQTSAGVEAGTEKAWDYCEKYGIPRVFYTGLSTAYTIYELEFVFRLNIKDNSTYDHPNPVYTYEENNKDTTTEKKYVSLDKKIILNKNNLCLTNNFIGAIISCIKR